MRLFAQVIVARPVEGSFTYSVPEALQSAVAVGKRVIVPFGGKRFLTGVIESLSPSLDSPGVEPKEIVEVLDAAPIILHPQIKLWHWLADYYMCTVGEVYKAALPGGLKPESESVVELDPDADPEAYEALGERDMEIVAMVRDRKKISLADLAKALKAPSVEARVARLVDMRVLVMHEAINSRYRRVKVQKVSLTIPEGDAAALAAAFDTLRRSRPQQEALTQLIALSGFSNPTVATRSVSRADLLDSSPDITWAHVTALKKKGLIDIATCEVSRFAAPDDGSGTFSAPLPALSEAQDDALRQIHESFLDHAVTLLRGVTSSGKTEIYIHLIDHVLRQGRQALFLVPEIALTTQLTRRLQKVFGPKVKIYHSKFTDSERVDIWRDLVAHPGPCVVIGARSAVFLPFTSLGLVIVDEEHEPSYKQYDPAPRYNGRDAAMVLAQMHGAKTLLGSATPTVETYYKAASLGKYGLVELTTRYGDVALPEIVTVDLAHERERRAISGPLADFTIAATRHTIADGRQVIFFHNRRGFSPRARCRMCQFVPKCDHCDVSLTYHKRTDTLECHYCGAVYPVPKVCPNCHEPAVHIEGYGTERIEETVDSLFPDSRTLRMDLDTTRSKDAYSDIIDQFSAHRADILVGTQMVTKGLDFAGVGLVAVVNADNVINYPDFRSTERAFNMLEQVAGRAGRRSGQPGKVIIQTYTPSHPVIARVASHDYIGFYNDELATRRTFGYPPFTRIINVYIRHREREVAAAVAQSYATRLTSLLGNRVSQPVEPPVARVASLYIRRIMLRIEPEVSLRQVKDILRTVFVEINSGIQSSRASVHYDVDPV